MILYGFFEITQTPIRIAKVTISVTLPMLVSYFFCYFKMYVVLLYGFFEITQPVVSIAKIATGTALPSLVSYFFSYFKM